MNRVHNCLGLIALCFFQAQFASEVVKIQPKEMWDTDYFLQFSIDNPLITTSQTITNFISDFGGERIIELPFSGQDFHLYEQIMAEGLFHSDAFEALSFFDKMKFFNMVDFFDVREDTLKIIFDETIPVIIELVDQYAVNTYRDYFKKQGKRSKEYKEEKRVLLQFLDEKLLIKSSLFARQLRNYFFEFYADNKRGLEGSSLWRWFIKRYGSDVARISFAQLRKYFFSLYFEIMRNRVYKTDKDKAGDIIILTDLPFTLYFEYDYPTLDSLMIRKTHAGETFFSIEDQLNSIFTSPQTVQHITILDISDLDLKYVPNSIDRLVNLEILNLSGDKNLERLPASIITLTHLKKVFAWGNYTSDEYFRSDEFRSLAQALEENGTQIKQERRELLFTE